MPGWLITLILNLVLKWGIPALIDWIRKLLEKRGIDKAEVTSVLTDYVEESRHDKRAARKRARERLSKVCSGVGCQADTKGI